MELGWIGLLYPSVIIECLFFFPLLLNNGLDPTIQKLETSSLSGILNRYNSAWSKIPKPNFYNDNKRKYFEYCTLRETTFNSIPCNGRYGRLIGWQTTFFLQRDGADTHLATIWVDSLSEGRRGKSSIPMIYNFLNQKLEISFNRLKMSLRNFTS